MSFFQALLMSGNAGLFVSASGSGTGTGVNADHAMSFANFLLATIPANAKLYFNRGDEFNFADYDFSVPVTIDAYGSGGEPIADGSEDISGLVWTDEGGGLYSTPMVTDPKWIWISGVCAKMAQSARIPISSRGSTTTVTISHAAVSGYTSIVGALVVIKDKNWNNNIPRTITNYNGAGVITMNGAVDINSNVDLVLLNDVEFFSANNEWVWDGAKLWVKAAASPSTLDIRMANATYGMKSDAQFSITNFEFKNYYTTALWAHDTGIPNISNCSFHDIRDTGVIIQNAVTGPEIVDNTFLRIGNDGVLTRACTDMVVTGNSFTNIGMQDNYGWQTWSDGTLTIGSTVFNNTTIGTAFAYEVDFQNDSVDGSNLTFNRNVISNVAYSGFHMGVGTDNTVTENLIDTFMNRFDDGGGIYFFHYRPYSVGSEDNEVGYNIVHGANVAAQFGIGIYIDNRCRATHIHHNTVYECAWGLLLNYDTTDHNVEYNNIRNNTFGVVFRQYDPTGFLYTDNINNQFNNNNIGSRVVTAKALWFDLNYSNPTWNPFSGTGGADNNHYMKTVGDLFVADSDNKGNNLTLAALRTAYGQDTNSVQVPRTAFLYTNPTAAISNENANSYYEDLDGNVLTTFTIDPFYSRLVAEKEYSNELVAASSQYYNAGTNADIQFGTTTEFSIGFWIKYASNPASSQIIISNVNGSTRGYDVAMLSTGLIQFNIISTPGTSRLQFTNNADIANNAWHYVLCVFRSTFNLGKVYVDDVDQTILVANNLTTAINSTHDLYIGALTGPSLFTDMKIDNVAIWNLNISGSKSLIYNSGRLCDFRNLGITQPIHYWKMGLADSLLDVGSNPVLNLTAVNSPTSSTDVKT